MFRSHGWDILLSTATWLLALPKEETNLPGTPSNTHLTNVTQGIPPRLMRSRYISAHPSQGAIAFKLGGCAIAAQYWMPPSQELPAIPTAPLHQSYFATVSTRS